jgi:putative membrane protein
MKLIVRIIINAIAFAITAYFLNRSLAISGGLGGLLIVAFVFALVNAFIRPIVSLFSLPITCLTLGLFTLVINALMLLLTDALTGSFMDITGDTPGKLLTAIIAALVISIISGVLSWFVKDNRRS